VKNEEKRIIKLIRKKVEESNHWAFKCYLRGNGLLILVSDEGFRRISLLKLKNIISLVTVNPFSSNKM
jgi:hypothetical protein